MATNKRRTLKAKISYRVKRTRKIVFLRKDFADLGGYDQVGRALREVMVAGLLVRIGQGVYAKARPSSINPSRRVLAAPGGFKQVSREALSRLGIKWRPAQAEEDYEAGSGRAHEL